MGPKTGIEAAAPRSQRRLRTDAATRGLVPPDSAPPPARIAPTGTTGVRVGPLARHRRPIGPVTVGKPMPAGPRGAVHAETEEPTAPMLPDFLRAASLTEQPS